MTLRLSRKLRLSALLILIASSPVFSRADWARVPQNTTDSSPQAAGQAAPAAGVAQAAPAPQASSPQAPAVPQATASPDATHDPEAESLPPTDPAPASEISPASPQTTQPASQNPASQNPASQNPASQNPGQLAPPDANQVKELTKQRMFGVMPNFNSTSNQQAPRLTVQQKYQLAFRSAVDPFQFALAGVLAGIGQAENTHAAYGQGMAGYGKRIGALYADAADGFLWGNAVLPALFHEDPRYFRKGTGKFSGRLWYAVESTIRCKTDDGKWTFSYGNVLGNVIAGGISNVYYPANERGVANTFESAATVTAEGAFGATLIEFWPDISRHLHHKHPQD